MKSKNNAFTLIELLVVIAIIGLLSTVVLTTVNKARAKARDARLVSDFDAMRKALQLYYDDHGQYPQAQFNCCSAQDHNQHFENVAQVLVDQGYLSAVPKDTINNVSNSQVYMYYHYGDPKIGPLLVTYLETIDPTTKGPKGSCRPFTNNWCSHIIPSRAYCICNPEQVFRRRNLSCQTRHYLLYEMGQFLFF